MQLVEQGKMDLDADVGDYITQFSLPNEFDTPLTLTHLLTHSPGLEDGAAGYLFVDSADKIVPLADSLAEHIPTQVRAPGTDAAYSNWATALAGLAVANVSGKSFETYIQDHILTPLGMQQATFEEPLPAELAPDMAIGYVAERGQLTPLGFEYIKNFGPAGALSASAGAMTKFMMAHLGEGSYEGQTILRPATVAQMHSQLFTHDARVHAMAHGFYETWRHGQRFIGHGGDTIAFHSEMLLDPTAGFGLFVSFNTPDGAAARSAIVNGVIDFYYPNQDRYWEVPALEGSAERVKEVAGTYRLNRRSYTELEGLIAFVSDLNVVPVGENAIHIPAPNFGGTFIEVAPYEFRKQGSEERFVFTQDENGAVNRGLIASTPIVVLDRIGVLDTAANHILIIVLTLLASLFVLINSIRNRGFQTPGATRTGKRVVASAAASNLIFVLIWGMVLSGIDMNRVVFDFPPPGTGFALIFPVLSVLLTILSVAYLIPVWRDGAVGIWPRLRYSYVTLIFVLFLCVLHYWHLIGWNY